MAKAIEVKADRRAKPVRLTLDSNESQFLYDLLQSVGGDTHSSRRKFSDAICKALKPFIIESDIKDMMGIIECK